MINLLSAQAKTDIRAGRLNVALTRYAIMILGSILFLVVIFGVGFAITTTEKAAAEAELETQKQEAQEYQAVLKESESFAKNLTIAKTIINNEIVYSQLLMSIAKFMPKDTVLSVLALDNTLLKSGKPIPISAEAKTYEAALKIKSSLEESPILESVNIVKIEEKPNAAGQEQVAYPLDVDVNVSITKNSLLSAGASR
jgi:Tfp pilus assembly protein PilN